MPDVPDGLLIYLAVVIPVVAVGFWFLNGQMKVMDKDLRGNVDLRAKVAKKPRKKKNLLK